MSDIVVDRTALPFVLGGATTLAVRIGAIDPLAALPGPSPECSYEKR